VRTITPQAVHLLLLFPVVGVLSEPMWNSKLASVTATIRITPVLAVLAEKSSACSTDKHALLARPHVDRVDGCESTGGCSAGVEGLQCRKSAGEVV